MRQTKIALGLLVMLATLGVAAEARAGSPTEFLKKIDAKMDPLLANAQANEAKIIKQINKMLDFDTLCKDSLGKHWEGRTDAEREEFVTTLKALIEKNVTHRLADTRDHIVTYESEQVSGTEATVTTLVASGTGPRATQTEIVYKMEKRGPRWVVVDMITDGVSLVQNYRSQFNKIITKDGWATLIQKMKDKLAEA